MEFLLLGPFEARVQGRLVSLGGSRQERVLAVLALASNRVVGLGALIDAVWDGLPPPTARRQAQNAISLLRGVFGEAGHGAALRTRSSGYQLDVTAETCDLHRYDALVRQAGERSATDQVGAAAQLRTALALWRGPALDGMTGAYFERQAATLEERRLATLESCIDLELKHGRHRRLVEELTGLTTEHPFRERLVGQLMVALYRSGRQADALAAYQRLVDRLREGLGIDPGAGLRALHHSILRADPSLDAGPRPATSGGTPRQDRRRSGSAQPHRPAERRPPAGSGVPAQLPGTPPVFVGRVGHLSTLDAMVTCLASGQATSTTAIITGGAGIGKTALAVHWGHRVRRHFPDGQLYVDLRGYAPVKPMQAIQALERLLRAWGVAPDQIPSDADEAAAILRSRLVDHGVLILLDNARNAEQVRPLLPAGPGCLTLVTSRDPLTGLVARDGARSLTLDVLSLDESIELLSDICGPDPIEADPRGAAELANSCGHWPLALRVAAADLNAHPERTVADQAKRIAGVDRLATLQVEDDEATSVRAAFDQSYTLLDGDAARVFRLLGLVPGHDVTPASVAALAGAAEREATRTLDGLAAAHLLEQPALGRFALHDLLRTYARERATDEEDEADRDAAVQRLYLWYAGRVTAAVKQLLPYQAPLPVEIPPMPPEVDFADPATAQAWLDAELANLTASIQHAAEHGSHRAAWLLSGLLRGYFWRTRHDADWWVAATAGLAAAQAEGSLLGQAVCELSLGSRHSARGCHEQAIEHTLRGMELAESAQWADGVAGAHSNLGDFFWQRGEFDRATHHLTESLTHFRAMGSAARESVILGSLSAIHGQLGQLTLATRYLARAIELDVTAGSTGPLAYHHRNLGKALHELGDMAEARCHLDAAMKLFREQNDRPGMGCTHDVYAEVNRDLGELDAAYEHARTALALAEETEQRYFEALAHNTLGSVHLCRDRPIQAREHHERALRIAEGNGYRRIEIEAHLGLAPALQRLDDPDAALRHAHRAHAASCDGRYAVPEGQALTIIAEIYFSRMDEERAADYAGRALDRHRETGHRPGEARSRLILARTAMPR